MHAEAGRVHPGPALAGRLHRWQLRGCLAKPHQLQSEVNPQTRSPGLKSADALAHGRSVFGVKAKQVEPSSRCLERGLAAELTGALSRLVAAHRGASPLCGGLMLLQHKHLLHADPVIAAALLR